MNVTTEISAAQAILVDKDSNSGLRSAGISFHWWDSRPTSLHHHNYYEFFIVTSGEIEQFVNGKTEVLPQGTMFFLTPEDIHLLTPPKNKRCIHINLGITEERLRDFCQLLNIDFLRFVTFGGRYDLSSEDFEFFVKRAESINLLSGDNGRNTIIAEMLCEVVAVIVKHSREVGLKAPDWFADILSKINSPDFIDKSATDIYTMSDYSAPVIISYFKKYTGCTIVKYLSSVKMSYARNLLLTTDMTTLDISGRLGYDSLSHFNHLFKERFGITPTEMRKSHKQ